MVNIERTLLPVISTREKACSYNEASPQYISLYRDASEIWKSTTLENSQQSQDKTEQLLIAAWIFLLGVYLSQDTISFHVLHEDTRKLVNCQSPKEIPLEDVPSLLEAAYESQEESVEDAPANSSVWLCREEFTALSEMHSTFVLRILKKSSSQASVTLWYDDHLAPTSFATLIAENYKNILELLVQDKLTKANFRISSKDVKTITDINSSILSEPSENNLLALFQKSVTRKPDHDAIRAWDGTLSYQQADRITDELAKNLIEFGVQRGDFVPFYIEKSVLAVLVPLAILKAGAAFVSLNPAEPLSRLQDVCQTAKAKLLIVSKGQKDKVSDTKFRLFIVDLDSFSNIGGEFQHPNLPEINHLDDAVVVFTSGSTGKPKGIVLKHHAVCDHLLSVGRTLKYQDHSVLQFSANSWDVFVIDVFTTWIFQGCVCVPSEEQKKSGIYDAFSELKVDLAMLTPSFAQILDPKKISGLKKLIVGGEALTPNVVSHWKSESIDVECFQMYGPAEVGICIAGNQSFSGSSPDMLGTALDNFICILVDIDDPETLVPVGSIGELVVGGPAVVHEYLDLPEKTKESFLIEPAWSRELNLPVKRFYRTGDLLRYDIKDLDGKFRFIGRKDSQIKFNGQRLEVGEIEHHLRNMEDVGDCLIAIPDAGIYKGRIVASIIERNKLNDRSGNPILMERPSIGKDLVKQHLSKLLPSYMVPSEVLVVSHILYTASMKIDRKGMKAWISDLDVDKTSNEEQSGHDLNHNELTAIALNDKIFEILYNEKKATISRNSDFNIQNQGLTSVELISLGMFIRERFGKNVPSSVLMDSNLTVRKLAAFIDDEEHDTHDSESDEKLDIKTEVKGLLDELVSKASKIERKTKTDSRFNILLTGASGNLGIEIIKQCLQGSESQIFAINRGRDGQTAEERLMQRARGLYWWREEYESRLVVWAGDLSKPKLDLKDDQYLCLTDPQEDDLAIHVVIHAGAQVNYMMDYSKAKKTNVSSLFELLRAVSSSHTAIRKFIFVSGGQELEYCTSKIKPSRATGAGYTDSKIVSEQLLDACASLSIYKHCQFHTILPGYIIGNIENCKPKEGDFIWSILAASAEIGYFDEEVLNRWIAVAPYSSVASQISKIVFESSGEAFVKVLEGVRFSTFVHILKEFGIHLQPLPRKKWIEKVRKQIEQQQEHHPLFAFGAILDEDVFKIGVKSRSANESEISRNAVRSNIECLVASGYFNHNEEPKA